MPVNESGVIPIEVFAAKDSAGEFTGVMMAVPKRCGLKQADTLRIDGTLLMAIRERSILPVDLPEMSEQSRANLIAMAHSGQRLAVAEFTALGLFDAYFLKLEVVR